MHFILFFFFFFQAEDGIRDVAVTGVQTCALPIYALQKSILEDHRPSELAVRLHAALEREFDFELEVLGGGRTRSLRLESVYTRVMSISGRPLTDGYHFGETIVNDFGRPFAQGANLTTGFSAAVQEGHFAIYVRGEYQHAPGVPALSEAVRTLISKVDQTPIQPAAPFPETNRFQLLDAYLALNFKNWQFSFGKQSLWWGPGLGGSLIFSNNAEPIPMMRLTRVVPFKLPALLGWLGPARVGPFFGQLSGHRFIETQSGLLDRKSTRLNSSHGYISYAVFCLKKKKKQTSQVFHGYT